MVLAQALIQAANGSDVKVSVVTTIGVIIAAGLTALATTFQRKSAPANNTPSSTESLVNQYIKGLELDRANKTKELDDLRAIYGHLRDACWERGLDPDQLISGQHTP